MKRGEMVFLSILLLTCMALVVNSCTDNQRAKVWGGKMSISLEPNQKLMNVTWKDGDMWILTRQMKPDDQPETYKFFEKSTFGVMEGEVTIVETRATKIGMTTPSMDIPPKNVKIVQRE